jgi:mono/diheme cytochrome c family protein
LLGLALVVAGLASGCGGEEADGAEVFTRADCGACHVFAAADAHGDIGPDLDLSTMTAEQIEAQVRQGTGTMPPFEGSLTDAEIDAVVAFVVDNRRGTPAS